MFSKLSNFKEINTYMSDLVIHTNSYRRFVIFTNKPIEYQKD